MGKELRMVSQAFEWSNRELKNLLNSWFSSLGLFIMCIIARTCLYEPARHALPTALALPLGAYLALT